MTTGEAYITGIGMSQVGRRLTRHPLLLTVDAVKQALDEAGLSIGQIDGVSTYPGRAGGMLGFSPVGSEELIEALRIKATFFAGGFEQTSQLGAVVAAVGAVKSGQARHVICFRTVYEAAALARPDEWPAAMPGRADGWGSWLTPFHYYSAANSFAQFAMRHMHRYGMTREQLAQIALTARANGIHNPNALVQEPLTMDEYMAGRMITSPLCIFDCDRFTDGSTVVIVSAGDAIDEVTCTPIRVAAMASGLDKLSWDQAEYYPNYYAGRQLWKNTDYQRKDVDTVQLYDGFSFITCQWLEGLGFCEVGEVGQFIEGGKRIARDGELPLNTGGGQIAGGRMHGFGFAHEAVTQLRGLGGGRQIPGDPKVAIAAAGGGIYATALLLARD
jgi:acetyl-CoA acetyltransferase